MLDLHEVELKADQKLGGRIVQVTRHPAPFIFLSAHQVVAQPPALPAQFEQVALIPKFEQNKSLGLPFKTAAGNLQVPATKGPPSHIMMAESSQITRAKFHEFVQEGTCGLVAPVSGSGNHIDVIITDMGVVEVDLVRAYSPCMIVSDDSAVGGQDHDRGGNSIQELLDQRT